MLVKYLNLMRLWPLFSLVGGLKIDVFTKVAQVDPKFLSVAIDSHVVAERWKNFDFDSDRVLSMARALAPAYLRLGGTAADLLTFKEKLTPGELQPMNTTSVGSDNCWCTESLSHDKSCENLQGNLYKNRTKFFMSGTDWIQINEFCKKVGWNFLFDFNLLKRNRKGNWR